MYVCNRDVQCVSSDVSLYTAASTTVIIAAIVSVVIIILIIVLSTVLCLILMAYKHKKADLGKVRFVSFTMITVVIFETMDTVHRQQKGNRYSHDVI